MVTLNPVLPPEPALILGVYDYAHPVFDRAACAAQKQLSLIQGQRQTWFAGAWTGYGFHEDGLRSGLAVADVLLGAPHPQGPLSYICGSAHPRAHFATPLCFYAYASMAPRHKNKRLI